MAGEKWVVFAADFRPIWGALTAFFLRVAKPAFVRGKTKATHQKNIYLIITVLIRNCN